LEKIKAYGICLYKFNKDSMKVLLCKSVNSTERWGFLKGVALSNEEQENTALREFQEESSIPVDKQFLENFFLQENELKDIGIYLVNYENVENADSYFDNEVLYEKNLSSENSEIQFFDIKNLPLIKKKQKNLTSEILDFLND